ncbi:MAG: hypothetical protein HY692_05580, partial [Cyanobacteria bacterium NC_groundwater_1444_Ag_S-0.65um_54_12]|nr:hypothetical protein [Cyanobacteria bacterium NC_groundwater_1444_Ag_S-0.65um_54_12]
AEAEPELDLVFGRVAFISQEGKILRYWGHGWDWNRMRKAQVVAHSGMLHNRRLFDDHGLFGVEYTIAGDYEFLLRLGSGAKTAFLNDVMVLMGADGASRSDLGKCLREVRTIQAKHPDIGPIRAQINYAIAHIKAKVRHCLGIF